MTLAVATAVLARRTGRRALRRSSRWWRGALVARSVEASELLAGRRLLVLAPHPDDETLGCGATVARVRAAGGSVTVVVATDGRRSSASTVLGPQRLAELRAAELRAACQLLGVPAEDVLQLGYPDGTLAGCRPRLAARLAGVLAERRPDIVLVPCAQDDHPDHQALHEAAVRAVRGRPDPCLVLGYPVWTWLHGPWFISVPARRRLPLVAWSLRQAAAGRWLRVPSGVHLHAKRAALAAHASQTTDLTGEPSWSYLRPEDCAAFLQPAELFLAVPLRSNRDSHSRLRRSRRTR